MDVAVTLAVGIAGGLGAKRLKVPAGAFIGALLLVAVFSAATGLAHIPSQAKLIVQTVSGIFIGSQVTRQDLRQLGGYIIPAALTVVGMVGACMALGLLIYSISDFDLVTSLMSSAPGGITDVTLISIDFGADVSIITLYHVVRIFACLGLFPPALIAILKRMPNGGRSEEAASAQAEAPPSPQGKEKVRRIVITLAAGGTCGVLGYLSGIPAGALAFSLVGSAAQNVIFGNAFLPHRVKTGAQFCAGALIGSMVTYDRLASLKHAFVPLLVLLIGFFVINLVLSFLFHRFGRIDLVTALFACVPGGGADICLIADDLGANTPLVSILQIARIVLIVVLYPLVITWLSAI